MGIILPGCGLLGPGIYPSAHNLSISLSFIYLFIYPSVHPSIHPLLIYYPSIHYLSLRLSSINNLSFLSIHPSIHPSIPPSMATRVASNIWLWCSGRTLRLGWRDLPLAPGDNRPLWTVWDQRAQGQNSDQSLGLLPYQAVAEEARTSWTWVGFGGRVCRICWLAGCGVRRRVGPGLARPAVTFGEEPGVHSFMSSVRCLS